MGEPLTQAFTAPGDMNSHCCFAASHCLSYSLIGLILDDAHQDSEGLVPWKAANSIKDLSHGLFFF